MSNRLKLTDRVRVTTGMHVGKTGKIEAKRGTMFVVVFDDGGHAQLSALSLKKVVTQ